MTSDPTGPPPAPDLCVSSYLEARSLDDDAVVRAAFDDLRERVRAEVKPPSTRFVVQRAQRSSSRSTVSRLTVAAAAAVLVAGTAATLAARGPAEGDATTVETQAAATPTAATAPPTTRVPTRSPAPPTTTTTPPRAVTAGALPSAASKSPTAPPTSPTATPAPAGTVTELPAPTSDGPSTVVTVYLWRGSTYPDCQTQYPVQRRIDGTGGWAATVQATLAGATADEQAQGYVSPFGPGVQAQVDEGAHVVDFTSRDVISDVAPGCRTALEELVSQTAQDAGSDVNILLKGSALLWLNWLLGLG